MFQKETSNLKKKSNLKIKNRKATPLPKKTEKPKNNAKKPKPPNKDKKSKPPNKDKKPKKKICNKKIKLINIQSLNPQSLGMTFEKYKNNNMCYCKKCILIGDKMYCKISNCDKC